MKLRQAVLIVLSSIILPFVFIKAYKNQVIADNKRVMYWRALQVKKVGLDRGLHRNAVDQAPLIEPEPIIYN